MKTVFITGASGGIGGASAQLFYQNGYNVAMTYFSNIQNLNKITSDFNKDRILAVKCDVGDKLSVNNAITETLNKFGTIDVLVNNAGIAQQKPFADISEKDWDNMFKVNVKGMYNCTKAVIDTMINKKSGSIINISSMWGETGASCEVHYSAAKAAIIGFTKALAKEMGLSGIRVNCVTPGVINTQMNKNLTDGDIKELIYETPLNRIGTPYDIANTVLYLASDKASFITGQIIGVNGGFVI